MVQVVKTQTRDYGFLRRFSQRATEGNIIVHVAMKQPKND